MQLITDTYRQIQIAQHLGVLPTLISEVQEWARVLWVRVAGFRPTFVSKKVVKKMPMIQVEVSRETVVVDRENNVAYVVRAGFDVGNFHFIKRFNPTGIDLRFLDYSSVKGESLPDTPTSGERSPEYLAVIGAIGWSKPSLVAYGETCRYPTGYNVE